MSHFFEALANGEYSIVVRGLSALKAGFQTSTGNGNHSPALAPEEPIAAKTRPAATVRDNVLKFIIDLLQKSGEPLLTVS